MIESAEGVESLTSGYTVLLPSRRSDTNSDSPVLWKRMLEGERPRKEAVSVGNLESTSDLPVLQVVGYSVMS